MFGLNAGSLCVVQADLRLCSFMNVLEEAQYKSGLMFADVCVVLMPD